MGFCFGVWQVKELDNRGSSFYIALYWAQAMAKHDAAFAPLAEALTTHKDAILADLIACQGSKQVRIGEGHFWKALFYARMAFAGDWRVLPARRGADRQGHATERNSQQNH